MQRLAVEQAAVCQGPAHVPRHGDPVLRGRVAAAAGHGPGAQHLHAAALRAAAQRVRHTLRLERTVHLRQ